jgi:low affinity Fe/Cu permease
MGPAERFARAATVWAGSSWAFGISVLTIIVWAVTGPFFHFSDTWQLVINTGTTIITFLMVFLIQRSQNNDSHSVHLKLNELVAAIKGASNRLIAAENLSEDEACVLAKHFEALVEHAKREGSLTESHSIEEATDRHSDKYAVSGEQLENE